MDGIEIYLYSSCSSCRQAEALLKEAGVEPARRDIFKDKLSEQEIEALFQRAGLAPAEMLSKRSRPYAELRLAERELSDDETIALMSKHPALIRRPIVVHGERAVVGFNRPALTALVRDEG